MRRKGLFLAAVGVASGSLGKPLGGKRRTSVLLGAAVLALAFGVSVGIALSGPGQVKVPIIKDSFPMTCPGGHGADHKQIGTVTAIRQKGNATFRGQVHGAAPGSYVVNLYDGDCNFLIRLGSFKVDGGGGGSFAKKLVLSFGQTFFLDVYNQDQDIHNATPLFKLGSSGNAGGAVGADLGVTKTVSNASPNVGDTVTFTVTVANAGPFTATNVTVTDLLPAGLTFVSATPSQGTYDATTGLWTIGTVTTGTPQTLTIQATVASPNPLSNTATITHSDQPDSNTGNNSASVGLNVQSADLAVSKLVSNPSPNVGDLVTFVVVLTDNGPGTATGVQVTDLLPVGLTFVSATPSQGTYTTGTGLWDVGTVTTGTPQTLTIQATVASASAQTNAALISHADQFDPNPANNTAFATETPLQADLAVTKAVSDSTPNVGDTVTFTVTLIDGGPGTATGVQVTDLLPAGLTFVSATPSQGTYAAGTGLWDVGTVAPGTPQTLVLAATVVSPDPRTNTATVSHVDQFDPNLGDNTASVTETPQQADLAVTKAVSDSTPNVGDIVTFTVTLTDNGPDAATNVQVADLLPAGLTFVSATPSQGTYDAATGVWTIGTVTTGTPQTLTIQATVASPNPLSNTATITRSDQFDSNTGNNSASATVEPPPRINIVKFVNGQDADTPTGPIVPVGSTVTFTYVVTNTGNVPLANVAVSDDKLGPITSFTGDTNGNGLLDLTETWTYTQTATAVAGQQTNTGTATGQSPTAQVVTDDNPANYFGSADVPGIQIVKFVNGQDADSLTGPHVPVGSTVTFTYVVTNTGNVPLANVAVSDDKLGPITSFTGDTNGNGLLDLTETWTYTQTATALAGQQTNTGTVTANDANNPPGTIVTDDNPGNYFGDAPAINIVKFVNGQDADTPTGPSVPVGSTVTFTYVVTNTGNVPLANVVVSDDKLGPITSFTGDTNGNGLLDLTETWTYTQTATALAGQQTNTGTATAQDPNTATPVTDDNPANYLGS